MDPISAQKWSLVHKGLSKWWPKKLLQVGVFNENTLFVANKVYSTVLGSNNELMEFLWAPAGRDMLRQFGIEFNKQRHIEYRDLTRLPYFWLPPDEWCQYQAPAEAAVVADVEAIAMDMSRISMQSDESQQGDGHVVDMEGCDDILSVESLHSQPPLEVAAHPDEDLSSGSEDENVDQEIGFGPAAAAMENGRRGPGRPKKVVVKETLKWDLQKSAAEISGGACFKTWYFFNRTLTQNTSYHFFF